MKDIKVGQKASRSKTTTLDDAKLYSRITGDEQSIHYDQEVAKRLGHHAPIVHGGVTTGLFSAIIAHDLPGPGSVFLNVNWNFRKAVLIGDTITAEVEVLSVREDKPIVHLKTTVVNQDGDLCVEGTALVYIRKID